MEEELTEENNILRREIENKENNENQLKILRKKYEETKFNVNNKLKELELNKKNLLIKLEKIEKETKDVIEHIKERTQRLLELKPSLFKPFEYIQILNKKRLTNNDLKELEKRKLDLGETSKSIKQDLEKNTYEIKKIKEDLNEYLIRKEIEINNLIEVIKENRNTISSINLNIKKGLYFFETQWLTKSQIHKLKETQIGLTNNFSNMSPFDFEVFIAKLLQEMGYQTEVTKKTGDYGGDVIAKKDNVITIVQCKRNSEDNLIGNTQIQKLLGCMPYFKAQRGIFVTTSHYTKQAFEQARGTPIELWDKDTLHKYIEKYLLGKNVHEVLSAIEQHNIREKEKLEQEKINFQELKRFKVERKQERKKLKLEREQKKKEERKKRLIEITTCSCGNKKNKHVQYCGQCRQMFKRNREEY